VQKIKTKTIRFKNCPHKSEDQELEDLIGKLHGLDTWDSNYAAGYARLAHHFPNTTRDVPKPEYQQATETTSTYLHQVTPPLPAPTYSYQAMPTPALPPAPYRYQAVPPPPLLPAQSWATHAPTPIPTMQLLTSNGTASFFWAHQHIEGCSFCLQLDHRIWMCPLASEYVHMGRTKVINDKL